LRDLRDSRLRKAAGALAASLVLVACSAGEDDDAPKAANTATGAAAAKGCDSVDLTKPPAAPVKMRIGHGQAAEEPFWLMQVDDALAKNKGKWYSMELKPFRATAERLAAYQAKELDAVTISPQAQIRGTAAGALDLYAIATIMREGEKGAFSTSFVAMEKSGIDSVEKMKGKTIAIVDEGTQLDFLARQGISKAGGDPAKDAKYVVFPFNAQEEALRAGRIDVAGLPEPFYTLAKSKGGIVDVFSAADVSDFAYDLLTVSFKQQFVADNLGAVCAWAADFRESMKYWKGSNKEARGKLVGTPFVQLPGPVYEKTGDYARPDDGKVDVQGAKQMLDQMIKFGILKESDRIDTNKLVRPGVSIGH